MGRAKLNTKILKNKQLLFEKTIGSEDFSNVSCFISQSPPKKTKESDDSSLISNIYRNLAEIHTQITIGLSVDTEWNYNTNHLRICLSGLIYQSKWCKNIT